MKTFRIAVIGCGAISGNHINAIVGSGNKICALCDIVPEHAQEKIEKFELAGVPIYTDYVELLEKEKPDSIHICTPHYLHAEMVIAALGRGIHVLCEKPLAINMEQLHAVLAAEEASTAQLGVCQQNRFEPRMLWQREEILGAIRHGRQMRHAKLEARLKYLNERFSISFVEDDIAWLYSLNSAAKPHLARLLVKMGLADTIADAIDRYLKGDGFPDDRIDAAEAIDAILKSGGIPVWAHPLGGEREERLTRPELEGRLAELISLGLRGIECLYSRYSKEDEAWLLSVAKKHGLLASGGSDYHGKNKTVELAKLASDGEADTSDISIQEREIGAVS